MKTFKEYLTEKIRPGMKFEHTKWLADDYKTPAVCRVTKADQGVVYFAIGDEKKGKQYFPLEQESRWVKRWLNEGTFHVDGEKPNMFKDPGIGTLKQLAMNAKGNHTMKFFISRGGHLTAGDSHYYTHNMLGQHPSEIWGGVTHDPATNTFKYAAFEYQDGKYPPANHELLDNLEKGGMTRGKWDDLKAMAY